MRIDTTYRPGWRDLVSPDLPGKVAQDNADEEERDYFLAPGAEVQLVEDAAPADGQAEAVESSDAGAGAKWLARGVAAACWFVVALLAVKFVFLVKDAWDLPLVLRVLALAGIGVAAAALAGVAVTLARLFGRLPSFEQVPAALLEDSPEARRRLLRYVRTLGKPGDFASRAGLDRAHKDEDCAALVGKLARNTDYADAGAWVEDFKQLAAIQDKAADARIQSRALCVAVKTAAAPWKAIDMAAVLYHALWLTLDLARIYNRRISRPQALRMAMRMIFAVGVSGTAQDVSAAATEGLATMTGVSNPVVKFVGAKGAEGSVNWLFFRRFGAKEKSSFRLLA